MHRKREVKSEIDVWWLGTAPRIPGRATTLMGCATEPGLNVPDSLQGRSPRGLFGRNAAENLNGPPPLVMPLIDAVAVRGVAGAAVSHDLRRLICDASLRPEMPYFRQLQVVRSHIRDEPGGT